MLPLILTLASSAAAAVLTTYQLQTQSHCSSTSSQLQWNIVPVPAAETGLPVATFTFTPTTAGSTISGVTSLQPAGSVSGNVITLNFIDDGPKAGFVIGNVGCDATTNTLIGWTLSVTAVVDDGTGTGNTLPVTITGDFLNAGTAAAAANAATTTATVKAKTTSAVTKSSAATAAATAQTATTAAVTTTAAAASGACTVTLPKNALTSTGLSTPWVVSGDITICDQTAAQGAPTFAECVIVNTNGTLGVYSPLLVNSGSKVNVDYIAPTAVTVPTGATVGCWFGTNAAITLLADNNNGADLKAANCVNGDPNVAGDTFGQFAACNAANFFAAANKVVTAPALGTGKNGKPCYTTRSFEVIDMDQSDNVVTSFLAGKTMIAQNTNANAAKLKAMDGAAPTEMTNGSDNLLLDAAYRPALGCTVYTAPNLAAPNDNTPVGALALNELQANQLQAAPIALVPPTDPFVLSASGAMSLSKQTAYRTAVNQGAPAGTTAEATAYCQNMLDVTAPSYITDSKFIIGAGTPDAANGIDLFTFQGQRFQASWMGLGCNTLITLDAGVVEPMTANRDANGVTQSVTFNTAKLIALVQANGGPTAEMLVASSTAATATTAAKGSAATTAAAAAAVAAVSTVTVTLTVAPTISVVVATVA
ncbi:hypothetical protein HDU83_009023 [Entophlyctis luteolus]|nr:hypothetical protein HDU83_009023 [Entophlyctis luteolus]